MTDLVERPLVGSVELHPGAGRTTVVLRGVVDVSLTEQLAAAVARAADTGVPVVVDASAATTIDTAVAASLAWLAVSCPRPVRLVGATDAVRAVLDSTGVAELLNG